MTREAIPILGDDFYAVCDHITRKRVLAASNTELIALLEKGLIEVSHFYLADPNEAYEIAPMVTTEHGPTGWFTVTRNGIPDRHHWAPDKALKYASDAVYRARIRAGEVMHHDKKPT